MIVTSDTLLSTDPAPPVARPGKRWDDLTPGERFALRRIAELEGRYDDRVFAELEVARAVFLATDAGVVEYQLARTRAGAAADDLARVDAVLNELLGREAGFVTADGGPEAKAACAEVEAAIADATEARTLAVERAAAYRRRADETRAAAEAGLAAVLDAALTLLVTAKPEAGRAVKADDPRFVALRRVD